MPKDKESLYIFRQRMLRMFPGIFRADQFCLFCLLCQKPVMGRRVFNVKQHLATAKHKLAVDIRIKNEKQLISSPYESESEANNLNYNERVTNNEQIYDDDDDDDVNNCNASQSSALIEKEMKMDPMISSLITNNDEDNRDTSEHKLEPLLELEYVQLRNYKMKLEILALERKLNIPLSKFTTNLSQMAK